jgi:hypothetical protein
MLRFGELPCPDFASGRCGFNFCQPFLPPPKSLKDRFSWLGPGVTWMAARAGSAGKLLFLQAQREFILSIA